MPSRVDAAQSMGTTLDEILNVGRRFVQSRSDVYGQYPAGVLLLLGSATTIAAATDPDSNRANGSALTEETQRAAR